MDKRIAISGTPVENKMTDLYNLFDFVHREEQARSGPHRSTERHVANIRPSILSIGACCGLKPIT